MTTTEINLSNDYETWNPSTPEATSIATDIRNPLTIFNTTDNQKIISSFFDDKNNLSAETKVTKTPIEDQNEIEVTTTTSYKIDPNKLMILSLPNGFGGNFTQDTYLYNHSANEGYNTGDVPTLEHDFLKKVYECPYNFSDDTKNTGKIVSRTEVQSDVGGQKKYEYKLNDGYSLKLTPATNSTLKNSTLYTAYITNNDKNGFDYSLTVAELKSLFDEQYINKASNLKDDYLNAIKAEEDKVNGMTTTTTTLETAPINPQTPPNTDQNTSLSNDNSGLSTGAILGISLATAIVILIGGTFTLITIRRHKKNKKFIASFDIDLKKEEKGK